MSSLRKYFEFAKRRENLAAVHKSVEQNGENIGYVDGINTEVTADTCAK